MLESAETTKDCLSQRLRAYPYEVYACLFLDNQHRMIAYEELFRSTIDGANIYPREEVKQALQHNAAAVIFAHSHPSGVERVRHADIAITQRLKTALDLVDIRMLEHIIIGDVKICSLVETGQI